MLATLALVDCATLEFGVAPCTQEGETQPLARAARDLAAEPSNCWSKLKQWLRAKAARSLEVLETELGPALARFSHSAGGCPVGWWLGGRPLAWARLHGVVNGVVWTHGVIALFSAIGSGLGDLRFLGRDAQAAAFRSMA